MFRQKNIQLAKKYLSAILVGIGITQLSKHHQSIRRQFENTRKPEPFTNQIDFVKNLVDEEGRPHPPIFCLPLATMWLRGNIDQSGTDCFKDKRETLKKVVEICYELNELADKGENCINAAFILTGTPYTEKKVDTHTLVTSKGVENALSNSRYALFKFPVRGEPIVVNGVPAQFHASAFVREENGDCKAFDANYEYGEKKGPCAEVYRFLAHSFKVQSDPEKGDTVITIDSGNQSNRPL